MSESTAWALVAASFLLLGFFGYASVTRSKTGMVFGAVISALVLNGIASRIFTAVEISKSQESGTIQEDQMQPDMPNLMAGLIMFGWAFFLGGFFVGRLGRRAQTKTKSELAAAPDRSLPPSLDSTPPIRGSDDSDPGRVTITALARQNVGGK